MREGLPAGGSAPRAALEAEDAQVTDADASDAQEQPGQAGGQA